MEKKKKAKTKKGSIFVLTEDGFDCFTLSKNAAVEVRVLSVKELDFDFSSFKKILEARLRGDDLSKTEKAIAKEIIKKILKNMRKSGSVISI